MNLPGKIEQSHTFEGGVNSDLSDELLPPGVARYMLNVRSYTNGEIGVVTNLKGNSLISFDLPDGVNKCMHWESDEEENRFYYWLYNSNGYNSILRYDVVQNAITKILQSITDTGGIDIMRFSLDHPILTGSIINNYIASWCDGFNPARKFNINKALDKSPAGYGLTILEDYITAYKKTLPYAPVLAYFTDTTRQSNYVYRHLVKAAARFYYDDGEISNYSDYSTVPTPPKESYLGVNSITWDNNGINMMVNTGSALVKKIEIIALISPNSTFVVVAVLDKELLNIKDNSNYTFQFYNDDNTYPSADPAKVIRPYSFLPRNPKLQAFINEAMVYVGFTEGFPTVKVDCSVEVDYVDLFLPSGSQNQLNNPSFINVAYTSTHVNHFLSSGRYNTTNTLQVGFDVKKGNVFTLFGSNDGRDHYFYQYTANNGDDATIVANAMKSYLRGIGFGDVVDGGIDNDGNVTFTYNYIGQWGESATKFNGSVAPVSFQSLQDNGLSTKIIKLGSSVKYAIIYEDEKKSSAYTSDKLVTKTKFITELGGIKQAIHTISINHQPPAWAKKYQIVRSADLTYSTFIQLLIQKAIDVKTTNNGEYIDLVVGSLFTYQKMHPNTVLTYEFDAGDRIRLIRDEVSLNYYPYFETEILSYNINTQETVNSNITLNGTDTLTIDSTSNKDYVGKSIIVNGVERIIVDVPSGNQYKVDRPYVSGTLADPVKYASFEILDRRGILRIRKPANINITDFSLVELYKQSPAAIDSTQKIYYDFGQKYEILNPGTDNRQHAGNLQDQTSVQPAKVKITQGNVYVRNRELPTNNSVPGTQVVVDNIEDPGYSDFYESTLSDNGRPYPEDDGSGEKYFDSRARYSNNYIQDTKINGLNDFDNLDRRDYNDPYGGVTLVKFRDSKLYFFKELKTAWTMVNRRSVKTADGSDILATSDQILNDLNYFLWEGGIGRQGKAWTSNGNYQYIVSENSGVILRIAGDGADPISTEFGYDKRVRELLAISAKNNLEIVMGWDREHDVVLISFPSYNEVIYFGDLTDDDWSTEIPELEGATYAVMTAPLHGTVIINDDGDFAYTPEDGYTGPDSFIYRAHMPDGTLKSRKVCITVNAIQNRPTAWRVKPSTLACITRPTTWRVKPSSLTCITEELIPINYSLMQQADPNVDVNLQIKDQTTGQILVDLVINGSGVVYVPVGHAWSAETYNIDPSTDPTATIFQTIKNNGAILDNQSALITTGNHLVYEGVASHGDNYNVESDSTGDASVIPIADFDFLVLRPQWAAGSGVDLDTFTYFTGTGTIYDGDNPASRDNKVGYAQNPTPPASAGTPPANRIIPRGSANPYLNWATDNTSGAGVEAILIDVKRFIADFPGAPVPLTVEHALVWYSSRATGAVTVNLTTYKGGTMAFNATTKDFDNTGGVLVNNIPISVNVTATSNTALLSNAQKVARVSYNKTTQTANLTLL